MALDERGFSGTSIANQDEFEGWDVTFLIHALTQINR
jgi:hypothetical protein